MSFRTASEIAPELHEASMQFFVPLQTMQPVNRAAFERLHALVVELMRSYKGSDRVSKSLLNAVYSMSRIISAELEHRPAERETLEPMAQKLERCVEVRNALVSARTSIGSPTGVPLPCVSM